MYTYEIHIFVISIYNIIIKYNKLYYIYQLQFYYTSNFVFKSFSYIFIISDQF